jgi:iron complex outermembrane receptor protein
MNIGKVLSVGSEVKYAGSFIRRKLDVKVNYSFTDARKRNLDFPGDPAFDRQLVYIPGDVFNASFGFTVEPLRINITHSIVGSRFLTSDNTSSLPSYRMTSANLVLHQPAASLRFVAKTEVNNIFDSDYEVFKDYPMPKRNYRLTVGIEY